MLVGAATERAGYLAGLKKVKLLREPEAAALAYGLTKKTPQIVLVFDLGKLIISIRLVRMFFCLFVRPAIRNTIIFKDFLIFIINNHVCLLLLYFGLYDV